MSAQIERALQEEVLWHLKAWPVLVFPIPNGVWLPTRSDAEKKLADRIIAQMKAAGQLVPGAPDLVVCWRRGGGLIELKRGASRDLLGRRPAGRLSETQRHIAERAEALEVNYACCTSWGEVKDRLIDWGASAI